MAKKKIQKAPKAAKGEEEDHSDHEPAQDQHQDAPKDESPKVEASAIKKGGKKAKGKQAESKVSDNKEVDLFPEQFRRKLDDFKSFYTEYLQLKASSSDLDHSVEFKKVSDSIRDKINEACSKVLKSGIVDAEKWIEDQKNVTKDQIKNVEKAESDTRHALELSGTFSASEIDAQLVAIHKKKQALEQNLQGLGAFQGRAASIYSGGIDAE